MSQRSFIMESLERRALLSTTPSPVIIADQAAVAHALETLTTLQANRQETLQGDRQALAEAWKHNPADVARLVERYRTTLANRQAEVAAARFELLQTRGEWAEVYRDNVAAIMAARGNPEAVAAARAKLANDRIEYRRRIVDATANVRDTRLQWRGAVLSDARAVQRARLLGGNRVQDARFLYQSHVQQFRVAIVEATQALRFARLQLARDLRLGL